jgi:septum formation protein
VGARNDLIIQIVRLILASASPRRAELLRAAGFDFDILAADVDESLRAGESPQTYVRRLAAAKSAAVLSSARRGAIILGADTAVVIDGDILGKPRDDEDAAAMLTRLSGRRHDVMTGVSLRCGAHEVGRVEITGVDFAPLTEDDVAWYVQSGEGRDKAGAYAIQGLASRFIPRIEGSYSNVVGLPITGVVELLTEISSTPPARRIV